MKSIRVELTGNKRENYHFYGFATAFLAWIYCAIPQLGESCGGISSSTRIPRILKFLYNRTNVDLETVSGELYPKLEPDAREMSKRFWNSIEPEGTPFRLQYIHFESGIKRKGKKQTNEADVQHKTSRQRPTTSHRASTQDRTSGHLHDTTTVEPSREHGTGLSSSHQEQMHGFSWNQRQTFIQEIGDYASNQVMQRLFDVDTQHPFVQVVGDYAADQVMMRLADVDKVQPFLQAIGHYACNEMMTRLEGFLPQYNDFMQNQNITNASRFQSEENVEQFVADTTNEVEVEDDPVWTRATVGLGTGEGTCSWGEAWGPGYTQKQYWGTEYTQDSMPMFSTPPMERVQTVQTPEIEMLGIVKPDFREVRRKAPSRHLLSPWRMMISEVLITKDT